MDTYNLPITFSPGNTMNATLTSAASKIPRVMSYAIQIIFTGTPTGSFHLEASNDTANLQQQAALNQPTHWTTVADSTFAVSAAGDVMWTVQWPGYTWVRVVYTDSSSGASTATITSAVINTH